MNIYNYELTQLEKIIKLHTNRELNSFTKALQNRDINKLDEYFQLARNENINLFHYQTENDGNSKAIYKSCKNIFTKQQQIKWLDYLSQNGFNILESNNLYNSGETLDFKPMQYKNYSYLSGFMRYSPFARDDQNSYHFFLNSLIEHQKDNFLSISDNNIFINTINHTNSDMDSCTYISLFNTLFCNLIKNHKFINRDLFKIKTHTLLDIFGLNIKNLNNEDSFHYLLKIAQEQFENNTYDKHTINFVQDIFYGDYNTNNFSNYLHKYKIPYHILNKVICDESEKQVYSKLLHKEMFNHFFHNISNYDVFIEFMHKLNNLQNSHPHIQFSFSDNFKLEPLYFRKLVEYDYLTTINKENSLPFSIKEKINNLNFDYKINVFDYMEIFFRKYKEDDIIKLSSSDKKEKACTFDTFVYAYDNYFSNTDINKYFPKILKKFLDNDFIYSHHEQALVIQKMSYLLTRLNANNSKLFLNIIKNERQLFINTLDYLSLENVNYFNDKTKDQLLYKLYSDKYIEKSLESDDFNNKRSISLYGKEGTLLFKIMKNAFPQETEKNIQERIYKLNEILFSTPKEDVLNHLHIFLEQYYLNKTLIIQGEDLIKKIKRL